MPQPVLLFGKFLRTTARADHDADLPLLIHRHVLGLKSSVGDGFARGGHAQRHDPADMFAFVGGDPGELVEVLHFAGDLYGTGAGIEACDPLHTTFSVKHGATERRPANSIRADHAHAGDHDSRFHATL